MSSNVRNRLKFAKISRKDLLCIKMGLEYLITVALKMTKFYVVYGTWTAAGDISPFHLELNVVV